MSKGNIGLNNNRLLGSRTHELTLVENPTMDERSVMNLKSNDSLKQEVKTNFY